MCLVTLKKGTSVRSLQLVSPKSRICAQHWVFALKGHVEINLTLSKESYVSKTSGVDFLPKIPRQDSKIPPVRGYANPQPLWASTSICAYFAPDKITSDKIASAHDENASFASTNPAIAPKSTSEQFSHKPCCISSSSGTISNSSIHPGIRR